MEIAGLSFGISVVLQGMWHLWSDVSYFSSFSTFSLSHFYMGSLSLPFYSISYLMFNEGLLRIFPSKFSSPSSPTSWDFHRHHSPSSIFFLSSHYRVMPFQSFFLHFLIFFHYLHCSFYHPYITKISFLIQSFLVTPYIQHNTFISATLVFFSCAFFTAQVSLLYNIAGYIAVLQTLPLSLAFIFLSQSTLNRSLHEFHLLWMRWHISASSSPYSLTCAPRYFPHPFPYRQDLQSLWTEDIRSSSYWSWNLFLMKFCSILIVACDFLVRSGKLAWCSTFWLGVANQHGPWGTTPSLMTSIMTLKKSWLRADTWCSPTLIRISFQLPIQLLTHELTPS